MKLSLKTIRRQIVVLCLLCFSCGCGIFGGSEGGPGGEEIFFDSGVVNDINVAKQVATISWDEGYVAVSGVNKDQTRLFGIIIPVSLYARGESIPLGADGFLGQTQKEGTFVLYQGTRLLEKNKNIETVYVSGSGSVNFQDAAFNYNGAVRGTVHLDHLIAIDNETGLFARRTTSGTASLEFDTKLQGGSMEYPVIFSTSKSVVSKGDVITVRGANLSRLARVGYASCDSIRLPFEILSDHEARITINEYPCSRSTSLYFSPDYFGGVSFPLEVLPPPHLKNFRVADSFSPTWRDIAHDTWRDLLLFRNIKKRLMVFSFAEGEFKGSVYWGKSVSSLDYLSHSDNLYAYYSTWDGSEIFSSQGVGEQDSLASVRLNPVPNFQSERILFGKGGRGFVAKSWELNWIDLDARTVSLLPREWRTPYDSYRDKLLRSWSREYILVNRSEGSRDPTVVFRSLEDGNFERSASVVIGQKVLGISEAADEFWTLSSVYDAQLNRLSDYGGHVPNWQPQNAIGIVFDPGNRYAILIIKNGNIHILNRQTREVLASNVPAVPFSALELNQPHFFSADGSKLLLTSRQMLHLVDLRELFKSVGWEY